MIKQLRAFLALEASGGLVLLGVTLLALLAANSPAQQYYTKLVSPGATFFINDVLMAVFFLLVGLEIRAEMSGGTLSTVKQATLPLVAALGGVVVPALIYVAFTHDTSAVHGWAVASATDIAFSLAVLTLVGARLPETFKIFLMAVAVIDDLVAVVIIALFYSSGMALPALLASALCVGILWALGKRKCTALWPFLLVGVALWFGIHASGIHATIAGVLLGLLVPPRLGEKLIANLHGPVAFFIVPLFAFANAGVPFSGVSLDTLCNPVALGIIAGLLFGKPLGICAASYLSTRLGWAALPVGVNGKMFFAMSITAGIGFTMSLFIGELAFAGGAEDMLYVKLGVMLGSLFSALLGGALLYRWSRK